MYGHDPLVLDFASTANRDHLRITQMLGQSSYITGYGVGTKDFGWAYGLTLGEDTISPGEVHFCLD
jgi:hypothetical protein